MLSSSCVSFLAGCGQENLHGVASGGQTTSAGYIPSDASHPRRSKRLHMLVPGHWAVKGLLMVVDPEQDDVVTSRPRKSSSSKCLTSKYFALLSNPFLWRSFPWCMVLQPGTRERPEQGQLFGQKGTLMLWSSESCQVGYKQPLWVGGRVLGKEKCPGRPFLGSHTPETIYKGCRKGHSPATCTVTD